MKTIHWSTLENFDFIICGIIEIDILNQLNTKTRDWLSFIAWDCRDCLQISPLILRDFERINYLFPLKSSDDFKGNGSWWIRLHLLNITSKTWRRSLLGFSFLLKNSSFIWQQAQHYWAKKKLVVVNALSQIRMICKSHQYVYSQCGEVIFTSRRSLTADLLSFDKIRHNVACLTKSKQKNVFCY